ncbi:MAG: low molecular weight protein-tyrosine-phosphatase [Oleiphilus sp.]
MNILFVCLGNICRSPTAQGVFEGKLASLSPERVAQLPSVQVDSAGTAAWHIGKSPDSRSQLAAEQRGYDLSKLAARQVNDQDFQKFDYIFAMDKANLATLQARCPRQFQDKLALFLDYAEGSEQEVPDPYYGGEQGFNHVLDLIESASDGFIAHLAKSQA